jgi:hypothetical protein
MRTIADALIQELINSGGQCTGIEDLMNRIPGDQRDKRFVIKKLEKQRVLLRLADNCKGGRGHKRTIKLLRVRRLSPCKE